jgi:hypothetical protein
VSRRPFRAKRRSISKIESEKYPETEDDIVSQEVYHKKIKNPRSEAPKTLSFAIKPVQFQFEGLRTLSSGNLVNIETDKLTKTPVIKDASANNSSIGFLPRIVYPLKQFQSVLAAKVLQKGLILF